MHIDFHYYMIRVLANKAGFSHDEAHIIAYASQFVDNNIRDEELTIIDMPMKIWYDDRVKGNVFDPVCTAHDEIMMAAAGLKKYVERRTYLPFHFIPEEADGVTKANGKVARKVMTEAINSLNNAPPCQSEDGQLIRQRELIGLGIALHSYADTWAHREFSAYQESRNLINDFKALTTSGWVAGGDIAGMRTPKPIGVGHSNAGSCADMSFLVWSYRTADGLVERNNPDDYKKAAQEIFSLLKEVAPEGNTQSEWNDIKDRIGKVISKHPEDYSKYPKQKSADYLQEFPECFPGSEAADVKSHRPNDETKGKKVPYDRYDWANAAFTNNHGSLWYKSPSQLFNPMRDLSGHPYVFNKSNPDYKWLFFHIKAGGQRKIIFKELNLSY